MLTLRGELAKPFRGTPSVSANRKRRTEVGAGEVRGSCIWKAVPGLRRKHRPRALWSLRGISEVRPASGSQLAARYPLENEEDP